MPKTWFQHDMNASAKDGLSNLLEQKNGCDLYGKFWLLQEFFYFSQMNNDKFKLTVRINEGKMVSVLKTNRRRLGTVLETFQTILGIVSERIQEPFGTVYETTMPKSLIYITKRNLKQTDVEVDLKKELDNKQEGEENLSPSGGSYNRESLKELIREKANGTGWKTLCKNINDKFGKDYENLKSMVENESDEVLVKIQSYLEGVK